MKTDDLKLDGSPDCHVSDVALKPLSYFYYLQQIGITYWQTRQHHLPDAIQEEETGLAALESLQQQVMQCTRCDLCKTRTQTVFDRGNPNARLMIIGEAPGFHEDQQGKPFVGKAGQLLNRMIESVGFGLEDVYIANVLKCRPPNNRDPQPFEIEQCRSYLVQQIKWVKPELIVAVGRFAGQFLIDSKESMVAMRQKTHQYNDVPVLISYHPAYLLRNPKDKKRAYQDWLLASTLLRVKSHEKTAS